MRRSHRQPYRLSRIAVFITFLICAAGFSAKAQVREGAVAVAPGPVTVELRLGAGQGIFHRGEVIPVRLTFSSVQHRKYSLPEDCERARYQYHAPPEFVDRTMEVDAAMQMYFGNCHGGSVEVDPGEKPVVVQQILNDRFRMDTPGKYRISVTVDRFGFPITSNTVDLEILPPDPAWEAAELKRGLSLLAEPRSVESENGCVIVRFLGTLDAELQMARSQSRCDFTRALINARNRKRVIAELERELTKPDSNWVDIRTLAFISLYEQHPEWYPEKVDQAEPNEPMNSELWKQAPARKAEYLRDVRLLAGSFATKTPQARAIALHALVFLKQSTGIEAPDDIRALVRSQMPAAFGSLTDVDRKYLLLQGWDEIKSDALVAALKTRLLDPIALRRLFELAPDEARPTILRELGSAQPKLDPEVLGILQEKELPEMDGILLARVKAAESDGVLNSAAKLLQRYASVAIANDLQAWVEPRLGKIWCGSEANLLAYFLRVAPSEGAKMLRQSMRTDDMGCLVLRRLAELRMSPEVEQTALAALDDPRPTVTEEALYVLRSYGSADSRKPLLEHFQQWHELWNGRAKFLDTPEGYPQARRESAYLEALGNAQGWLTSLDEWRSLRELCVTDTCKELSREFIDGFAVRQNSIIGIAEPVGDEFTERFGIEPGVSGSGSMDRLKQKMSQYPKGFQFRLDVRNKQQARVQRIYTELEAWTTEHGFELEMLRE
jgi:hypothetical protein